MRKALSIMSVVSLGVCALAYGCSDDEKTNTLPRSDAGGGGDSAAVDSGGGGTDSGGNNDSGSTVLKAKATLAHTGLPNAGTPAGTVEFEDNGTSTTVKISVTGATAGDHGVHVHANGDCSTVDGGFGAGAGGHWNPTDAGHGFPTGATHHAGDLGNVTVAAGGTGTGTVTTTTIKLKSGDTLNPTGKAVIFHQGSDDGVTQPTGDAGTRAACGIIQAN
jgi:superoxide dismutase, Cu-Zn family